MSSGEEFEVDEILEQRKRKGVLEYLVRWRGFNDLYDSWEPAAGLADCTRAIKAFVAKTKRSRSKSRSRSRGRPSKSRSRSGSRGRVTKSDNTPKRSRSRSTGRKSKSSSKTSSEITVTKQVTVSKKTESGASQKEFSLLEQERPSRLRSHPQATGEKSAKREEVMERSSTKGQTVERQSQVIKSSVETVKSTPGQTQTTTVTTRKQMAVQQVQNDQKPAGKSRAKEEEGKEKWWWWFADHGVLILFIIVSLISLSFTIESIAGVRDKLVPDFGVLRQRLGESYQHFVQGLNTVYNNVAAAAAHGFTSVKDAVFQTGDSTPHAAQTTQATTSPPSPQAAS